MDLTAYQNEAWRYDQHPSEPARALTVALLGLGGEVGTLQTSQKKLVRDGVAMPDYASTVVEDLGDILWYVADVATWLGVDLDHVARSNLAKIADRWLPHGLARPSIQKAAAQVAVPDSSHVLLQSARSFDSDFPALESLPSRLRVDIAPIESPSGAETVVPVWEGRAIGNMVTDNSYTDDGYRFHDVMHLAHLAVLGWSPVMRSLLKRKRKSRPRVDEVEDGGRAIAIEEGLTAFVFEAATRSNFFESSRHVDSDVLTVCRRLTAGLEVSACSSLEWEQAILQGYEAWRFVRKNGNGAITCDLSERSITYRGLSDDEILQHRDAWRRANIS